MTPFFMNRKGTDISPTRWNSRQRPN